MVGVVKSMKGDVIMDYLGETGWGALCGGGDGTWTIVACLLSSAARISGYLRPFQPYFNIQTMSVLIHACPLQITCLLWFKTPKKLTCQHVVVLVLSSCYFQAYCTNVNSFFFSTI